MRQWDMEAQERRIVIFKTSDGRAPFKEWLDNITDQATSAAIVQRLTRLRLGLFGDCKAVGGGVSELRINHGPGYRVYFALSGDEVVLILVGGTKQTQRKDIKTAQKYWAEVKKKDAH
jgi:putative addiction module killer protein